jgi:two-component system, NtrC family, sensor kinase
MSGYEDAFVINHEGVLQTSSHSHGDVLKKISIPVPRYSINAEVLEEKKTNGESLVVGYAYIEDTPFILMIVKEKAALMNPWYKTRLKLIGFLAGSITIILIVILWVATYLVNKIYVADQRRVTMLHQVEYSNKMATIGRLAAGVAHEINNPLAIINEKAGLIKDLFSLKEQYARDEKLMALVDSVISSVDRCATITRRLLSFMRASEATIKPLDLKAVIHEVLGFLGKEAEYRAIALSVHVPEDMPPVDSDRSRLQEIFLNIINNAFAAVNDGGHVEIIARREDERFFSVTITDDGCGIPEKDLNRVFEPFFSTKANRGGTGLGLSITSGLVRDLGGEISVKSEVGKGTSFIVKIPYKAEKKGSK